MCPPIYEYRCAECPASVEALQKFDDPAPNCPRCADTLKKLVPMKKQVSRTSFRLEGGGWARDGYKG